MADDDAQTPAAEPGEVAESTGSKPQPPTPVPPADAGYTPAGVPTLDGVREKIETRYGTALGATELAEQTPEVRSAAERYEARQHAAADKIEEIRASMHKTD